MRIKYMKSFVEIRDMKIKKLFATKQHGDVVEVDKETDCYMLSSPGYDMIKGTFTDKSGRTFKLKLK